MRVRISSPSHFSRQVKGSFSARLKIQITLSTETDRERGLCWNDKNLAWEYLLSPSILMQFGGKFRNWNSWN